MARSRLAGDKAFRKMDYLDAVERVEREAGLVFTRKSARSLVSDGGGLRSPRRGKLALGKGWNSSYPWQVLRVAVHTYLSLAVNVSGPHFRWNESRDRMEFSSLGERLLLCLDLARYEQELLARDVRDSMRSAAFVESAHFLLFQELLAREAEAIKGDKTDLYLESHRFTREDVLALQSRLDETLGGLREPQARKRNKGLYDEAYHTDQSIQSYLNELRAAHPRLEAFAFEICLDTSGGHELAADKVVKRARHQLMCEFPENFLEALKQSAAFVAYLKKQGSAEIKGHLIKLSATELGEPRCTLILVGPKVKELLESRVTQHFQLSLLWADFMLGPWGMLEGRWGRSMRSPGLRILQGCEWSLTEKSSSAWKVLLQFVHEVYVKELYFMRLLLPPRKRSWSKGGRN